MLEFSWQSTHDERYSVFLRSCLAVGTLPGWRQWLSCQIAACIAPLHPSIAGHGEYTCSTTRHMAGFSFSLLVLFEKQREQVDRKASTKVEVNI